jgi:ribosomal protein L37AE/L43A
MVERCPRCQSGMARHHNPRWGSYWRCAGCGLELRHPHAIPATSAVPSARKRRRSFNWVPL